ncbi:MAG: HesA/MoeB/ThiF family protein [Candidatus Gastranaerophilales bacterium]|nr:HesA/MoeB/ThiF family protein [Candidatus Gastranaerophilales bacterium]
MLKQKRYENNLGTKGISIEAQDKLLNSKVLIMGAGGLGSGVLMNLCALGVGQIKIIDEGIVSETDFNRQIIHKMKNIGRARVISAKDWINEFNPDVKVELDKIRIDELNYFNVIQGYDIIVDCFDTYEAKFMLNEIALRHKKILIHGKVSGFNGQVTTIVPDKTGCLSCVIQKPAAFKPEQKTELSPIVSTIAGMQSAEVLKVITGIGTPLLNRMVMYDGFKGEFRHIAFSKNPACRDCSKSGEF